MTTRLTADGIRVLTALRAATVLRREPKTLTPDGHEHWWTITELANAGWFDGIVYDARLAELAAAARGLRKRHLAAGRTMFTVTRFAITSEGLLALAGLEAAAGVADLASADMEADQAAEDVRQAKRAERRTLDRVQQVREAVPRRTPEQLAAVSQEAVR